MHLKKIWLQYTCVHHTQLISMYSFAGFCFHIRGLLFQLCHKPSGFLVTFLHFVCFRSHMLTSGSLKFNFTDVIISLPGIIPNFSSSMTFTFVGTQEMNLICMNDDGGDKDDWWSAMSKFKSQSFSAYVFLLAWPL